MFFILLNRGIVDDISDLKHNLTIDQVHLFYKEALKENLSVQKRNAITLANALIYTSPSQDRTSSQRKQRYWERFLRSLDWDWISTREKAIGPSEFAKSLSGIGVPINIKKKKDDK